MFSWLMAAAHKNSSLQRYKLFSLLLLLAATNFTYLRNKLAKILAKTETVLFFEASK
jgi:hypothetical protein